MLAANVWRQHLKDALGWKVKEIQSIFGRIQNVTQRLPCSVLIVPQRAPVPMHVRPVLTNVGGCHAHSIHHILFHILCSIPLQSMHC